MRIRALLILAIAGAAFQAAPAMASEPATLTVGPTRAEFIGEGLTGEVTVTVTVSGGVAGTLALTMVDAAIDPRGGWLTVPYGSTPQTLDGVLTFEPSSFAYVPDGDRQRFNTVLSVDPALVTAPLFGSLRATLEPDESSGGGISLVTQGAVEIQVVAAPSAGSLEDLPAAAAALRLDDLSIFRPDPWTPIDRLFPDIPWLVNHGPVTVTATGANTGTLFLDSRVTYDFTRLSPLAVVLGGDGPTFTVINRPRYLIPGSTFTDVMFSVIEIEGAPPVDAMPFIGFVRITATASGLLSGVEAEPVSISRTVLVFPWKEALFLFLVWLGQREWRHRRGRRVNTTAEPPEPTLRARVRGRAGSLLRRRVR